MNTVNSLRGGRPRTTPVLDVTLGSRLEPGTNVKGDVNGANWVFLRPRVDCERAVLFGPAPLSALKMLAAVSETVTVAVRSPAEAREVDDACRRAALANVETRVVGRDHSLALPFASVDLAVVNGWMNRRQLQRPSGLAKELRRLLKADGLIYYERRGHRATPPAGWLAAHRPGAVTTQHMRLMPPFGEMQSAVPVGDDRTVEYLRTRGLCGPVIETQVLARSIKRSVSRLLPAGRKHSWEGRSGGRSHRGSFPWRAARIDALLDGVLRSRIVRGLGLARLFDWALGRRGVLVGASADLWPDAPPLYLRRIAAASGVSLDGYRWGLAARGRYTSRKVLFFLTGERQEGGREVPSYVVKLVRSPALNTRLENEYRALHLLRRLGLADDGAAPWAVFFGYHAGRAVIGETTLEGAPFRERTAGTPDCPYLRDALASFRTIAARSARDTSAEPGVSGALHLLLQRLTALYRIAAHEQRFLEDRIAALASAAPPLVLQHGDPGPWNMLVTPRGRVALLDWEAAEPSGLPLWDLFYFLRAYCTDASQADAPRNPLAWFEGPTPLGAMVIDATHRYCADVGVPPAAVEPLFYTCWMHRALKEATRLERGALDGGYYVNLLRLTIARREAPALARLFTA